MTISHPALPHAPQRVHDLRRDKAREFLLIPTAPEMAAMADALKIDGLRKLRFAGTLDMVAEGELHLTGHLGATVIQPCVVTLAPVTTRVEADVIRRFLADMPQPDPAEEEVEMPEDETIDPLQPVIDLAEVMIEALALHLPLYPRAKDADLEEAVFSGPGILPMRDEDARPFAGLAALRDTLKDSDPETGDDGG
ncbi:DUF177 domain-containing protein [Rhodophyticola sp. CCM32]|uniref:YceD family protein n=1 Tax=Rhodophyticola sp. CCM32 TaxID=2916397 RepID=UPI00107EF625|nr:DUF177 domain-containing protein [Rhodophyticola sp. CCM32]QBY00752.1 DUF177 domain-containing protein [Rhodophyticola sp. CCM32]